MLRHLRHFCGRLRPFAALAPSSRVAPGKPRHALEQARRLLAAWPCMGLALGTSTRPENLGLQAFPTENLLCALEPLSLLSFYHRVIKQGIGNPLCFGVENRGFFLVPEVIMYESLCDHWDE